MIIPILRYTDTDTALAFLTDGLGFEVHGEIMLSDAAEPTPREVYFVDPDPDAAFTPAAAAGAEVVYEPKDQSYGAREFAVKDPEGTTWYVGTYRPS